jgi:2-haloacid dehalogenase
MPDDPQPIAGFPVEAVVFDVGRVLVQWDLRCLFAKLIDDPDELAWFVAHVVTEEWHFQHDAGRPLAEMVPERIAAFPRYRRHIEAYASRFNETVPGPVPGSLELVEALHGRSVPLYAITNFGAEFWPGFRATMPVFDRFRDIVVSGVEKVAKPDPAIFALAQRRFGHAPQAMLFIDDNAANVAAARALGWQTHHFRDASALAGDLRARGLLP